MQTILKFVKLNECLERETGVCVCGEDLLDRVSVCCSSQIKTQVEFQGSLHDSLEINIVILNNITKLQCNNNTTSTTIE